MARTDCSLDGRKVVCPNASTLGYGKISAQVGDWVSWSVDGRPCLGRMIARIRFALTLTGDKPIRNWLLVAMLSCESTSCCELWVDPSDVDRIHANVPDIARFLAWFASDDFGAMAKRDPNALRGVINYGAAHANMAADHPDLDGDKRRAVYFAERAKRIAEHGDAARDYGLKS